MIRSTSFGNRQPDYPDLPPWRPPNPNGPRQFQPWNQTPNYPRFNQPYFNQRNNEDYWCETCDRGFPSNNVLEKHKQQHQKCNIDGCQFIAHPKVITKHIQMQHSTGLYKKIAILNNPEQIQKWIEERKNKYPTKENVEKKEAETKEKIDRGEKMGMTQRQFKDKNIDNSMKRKYPFSNNHRDKKIKSNVYENKPRQRKFNDVIPSTADNKKLRPFAGIQSLLLEGDDEINDQSNDSKNDLIEDIDDHLCEQDLSTKDSDPVICGALSSLICNYGSSDEEECPDQSTNVTTVKQSSIECNSDENKFKQNNIVDTNNVVHVVDKSTNLIEDDDSGPEEIKAVISNAKEDNHSIEPTPTKSVIDKRCARKSENKCNKKFIPNRKSRSKLPSTLLQKLLHNEIRQERNKVLQCIRYIVSHNYFNK